MKSGWRTFAVAKQQNASAKLEKNVWVEKIILYLNIKLNYWKVRLIN